MLALTVTGDTTARPPLLIVHGLFGSARNWNVIAKRLSDQRQVLSVDMRNHGASPWNDDNGYRDMADDLAKVIAANGGRADVLGHSMGGKAAMVLALMRPDLVNRLVVADIAPVAYEHSHLPLIAAMRKLDLSQVETRRDADAQLAETIPEEGVRAFLLQSLDVKGKRWRLNLDVLEAEMPKIVGWPEDVAGSFDGPVLMLSGADSHYIAPAHRAAIRGYFPSARFVKIPGAGHWLHAEKPRDFEQTVRAFLDG